MTRPTPQNHLLSSLSAADFACFEPHLEQVGLSVRLQIEEPNKLIKWAYFPDSGIVSVVATAQRDEKIEVGIIGQDGMTGVSIVQGSDRSVTEAFVQVAGDGWRLGADRLRDAMARRPSVQAHLLRYAQAFAVQVAYTALANGRASIEMRLARWLLMAKDRSQKN